MLYFHSVKYFYFVLFFWCAFGSFAQRSDFDKSVAKIEDLVFHTDASEALSEIYTWESNDDANLTTEQTDQLRILKATALIEIQLLPEAIGELKKVKSIATQSPSYQVDYYLQLALANEWLLNMDKVNKALDSVEELFVEYPEVKPRKYGQFLYRKSSYYRLTDRDSLFHHYAHKSIDAANKYGDKKSEMISSMLVSFYHKNDDIDSSLVFMNRALELSKELGVANMEGYTLANLSDIYFDKGEYKKALACTDDALKLANDRNLDLLKSKVYEKRSEIYEKLTIPDSALFYHKKFHEVEQAVNLEEKRIVSAQHEREHTLEVKKLEHEKLVEQVAVRKRSEQMLLFFLIASLLSLLFLGYLLGDILIKRNLLKQKKQTIEEQNEKLQGTLKEKDLLLKELNHRVKNNLAMILSLVRLQKDGVKANDESWENLENRINAIAFAHQLHSYSNQSEGSKVNLKEYCQTLFDSLVLMSNKEIKCQLNVDSINIKVKKALPIGILLNELITNSIKHAFPLNGTLELTFSLHENDGQWEFNYADNGTVFHDAKNQKSSGLEIIGDMVDQLNGSIIRNNSSYSIIFKR